MSACNSYPSSCIPFCLLRSSVASSQFQSARTLVRAKLERLHPDSFAACGSSGVVWQKCPSQYTVGVFDLWETLSDVRQIFECCGSLVPPSNGLSGIARVKAG